MLTVEREGDVLGQAGRGHRRAGEQKTAADLLNLFVLGGGRAAERSKEKSKSIRPEEPHPAWGKAALVKVESSPAVLETGAEEMPAMGSGRDCKEQSLGNIRCQK